MNAGEKKFDLVIIGAGINGAGIARDAAMRGLRVAILDQSDFCSGTSAASSRLIHGGLRYLEYGELPLVYESLHERRNLRQIAGHLVQPLRIAIPVYESAKRGRLLIRLGMIAYDLLSMGKRMPGHDMLSADEMIASVPGLSGTGLRGGARYYDAQIKFVERLVLENLLAARAAGAEILTYHRVTNISTAGGRVTGVDCTDVLSGQDLTLAGDVVVNAVGPWVDSVLKTAVPDAPRLIGGTKGSHIVVSRFDGAPDDALYVEAAADGRPFFIIPWNDMLLIGTTDIRYDESLDEVRASRAEVDYLLEETNRVFPLAELDVDSIHYAYAGIRPLPKKDKGPESAVTRKHIIRKNTGNARGLVTIIGGKLTTYRNLGEQTVDYVGRLLKRRLPQCRTHDTPLPGAWGLSESRAELEQSLGLSSAGVARILSIYGARSKALIALCSSRTEWSVFLDTDNSVLAGEVIFALREEFAKTLEDIVYRRMMIGFNADQGRPHYSAIAELAGAELDWSPSVLAERLAELQRYSDSFLATALRP